MRERPAGGGEWHNHMTDAAGRMSSFEAAVVDEPELYLNHAPCTCGRREALLGTSNVDATPCDRYCESGRAQKIARLSGAWTEEFNEVFWRQWGEPPSNRVFKARIDDFYEGAETESDSEKPPVENLPQPRFKVKGILKRKAGKRKRVRWKSVVPASSA